MIILDGKKIAEDILIDLTKKIAENPGRKPTLLTLSIGSNPESFSYIQHQQKQCNRIGMKSNHVSLPDNISPLELKNTIKSFNDDVSIDGIILQMPLPKNFEHLEVISWIDQKKDVDGIHPINLGKLMQGKAAFVPATPLAVMHLLKSCCVSLKGKKALIIGRSLIVGKPLSMLLLEADCTVTLAHSKTLDLTKESSQADILIAAAGQAGLVKYDYIKKDAIVIDVGINFINGKMVGDVAFDEVAPLASYITPVPGGVGPITTAMLLSNTWQAFLNH